MPDEPLVARHPEIPAELALQGFDGVRAYGSDPGRSRKLLEEVLGFSRTGAADWEARGAARGGIYGYDAPPAGAGVPGAGTVHHVAWASTMEEHEAWQRRVTEAGMRATPVIDRFWFRSVYFREPSGVLFEIATLGPGFGIDEDPDHLGESLILPPAFEHLRSAGRADADPDPRPAQGLGVTELTARFRPAASQRDDPRRRRSTERSSSSTAGERTSTISTRSSISSIPSGACSA